MTSDVSTALPRTMPEFWEMASGAWSTARHLADRNVQALARADLPRLRAVLIQYRWFTSYFTGDLALLIYKLPPSSLRTLLGHFVAEELGMNDPAQAHPAMYDRFLLGLGVSPDQLETEADPRNLALLARMREKLLSESYMYAVGLRGMGAECLCQVYLEAVHHHLLKNPEIVQRRKDLDWTFWDIHASEADQMHGEMTRKFIERLATEENIPELAAGYLEAERTFMEFWANAYEGSQRAAQPQPANAIPLDGLVYSAAR
ncbi:MAG: iron-containing redox enzyme family protein [Pseudomonadota bacterium]